MNPARYNINVYQGATFNLSPVWKIGGIAVNLTGYTADMQVRQFTDTAIITEMSTSNGRIVINGSAGQINITLDASQTGALTAGQYMYDLNVTDTSGNVYKILQGAFVVNASVTH